MELFVRFLPPKKFTIIKRQKKGRENWKNREKEDDTILSVVAKLSDALNDEYDDDDDNDDDDESNKSGGLVLSSDGRDKRRGG